MESLLHICAHPPPSSSRSPLLAAPTSFVTSLTRVHRLPTNCSPGLHNAQPGAILWAQLQRLRSIATTSTGGGARRPAAHEPYLAQSLASRVPLMSVRLIFGSSVSYICSSTLYLIAPNTIFSFFPTFLRNIARNTIRKTSETYLVRVV